MRKRDELTDPQSCLNRARDDEWIFVILGRDDAIAETVLFWADKRIELGKNKAEDSQIVTARQWAEAKLAEQRAAKGGFGP